MTVATGKDSAWGSARGFAADRASRGELICVPARGLPADIPGRLGALLLSWSGDECERGVVLALGPLRGAVPKRGVQPPAVVELLDVLEDRAARLLVRGVRPLAQSLLLQCGAMILWRRCRGGCPCGYVERATRSRNASAVYWQP